MGKDEVVRKINQQPNIKSGRDVVDVVTIHKTETEGKVVAEEGRIGGWEIGQYTFEASNGAVGLSSEWSSGSANWRFWAGSATPGGAPFRVDENGNLYSASGQIGKWWISVDDGVLLGLESGSALVFGGGGTAILETLSSTLYSDNIWLDSQLESLAIHNRGWQDAGIQLEHNAGAPRIYIGDGANQFLEYDGAKLTWKASNTELDSNGNLTVNGGQIGGWTITSSTIKHLTSSEGIILDATNEIIKVGDTDGTYIEVDGDNGWIGVSDFASGHKGWRIDQNGDAEFLNVVARGAFRASVFEYEEISAINGALIVTKASGILSADFTEGTDNLKVRTPESGGWLFEDSDVVRIKSWDGSAARDLWLTVTRTATTNEYTYTRESGTAGITLEKGTAVVGYGASGEGGILLDAADEKPQIDIFENTASPWSGTNLRVRIGDMDSAYNATGNYYGIGIGDYSGGNYLAYNPNDGFKLSGAAGDVVIDSSSASITVGTGTKDSDLNGWNIGADDEIVGQSSGADQVTLNINGQIEAGGGNTLLDGNGIRLIAKEGTAAYDNSITVVYGGDAIARFYGAYTSTSTAGAVVAGNIDKAYPYGYLNLASHGQTNYKGQANIYGEVDSGSGGPIAKIEAIADDSINEEYINLLAAQGVRISHGLYVGATGTAPDDNDIHYDGDLHPERAATETGYIFVPIKNGSTNTSYDGDTISADQTIDLQSGWTTNIPSDAVAVAVRFDWESDTVGRFAALQPSSGVNGQVVCWTQTANERDHNTGTVNLDGGDMYLDVSGAGQVRIYVLGYWI